MGWNIHAGQTAGYIGGSGNSTGGSSPAFGTSTQIPFVGAYVAATNGGLFADALVRMNWYENSLDSPGIGLNSQKLDAHGMSASASLGYHWDMPGDFGNRNLTAPDGSVINAGIRTTEGKIGLNYRF